MRKKRVWRYYCDYCRKAGCSAGHMRKHEKGCTANPDRVCGMCKMVEGTQKPLAELVAVFDGWKPDTTSSDYDPEAQRRIKLLEDLTDGCPACMLATARFIVAKNKNVWLDIGFKGRCADIWSSINAEGYHE